MNDFISMGQAAEILDVHRRYLETLIKKHNVKKYKVLGKTVVVRKDIEKMLTPIPVKNND